MITIISGTNRLNSKTALIANQAFNYLKKNNQDEVNLIDLAEIQDWVLKADMYSPDGQDSKIQEIQDRYMIPADKFLIISPEYNGSFPGILKLFIDACSIRSYKETFSQKNAALIGVASGRAGNLRGIDHLRSILSHVGTNVLPSILPISSIGSAMEDDQLNTATIKSIEEFCGKL